jgi:nitrogen regulatory protein PII
MKEINAYVRPGSLAHLIDRLETEGTRDFAVTRVDATGTLANTEDDCLRRDHKYQEQYADVDRFVNVLREASANGAHGDGRIFVLNIEQAVNLGDAGKP